MFLHAFLVHLGTKNSALFGNTMDLKSIGSNAVPVRVRPRVLVDKRL